MVGIAAATTKNPNTGENISKTTIPKVAQASTRSGESTIYDMYDISTHQVTLQFSILVKLVTLNWITEISHIKEGYYCRLRLQWPWRCDVNSDGQSNGRLGHGG